MAAAVVGVTMPTTVWLRTAPLGPPADLLPLPGSETERKRFVMRAQLVVTSCKKAIRIRDRFGDYFWVL